MTQNIESKIPEADISISDLITRLIKKKNTHSGTYDTAVKFEFAVASVGPAPDKMYPGAILGISAVGLVPSQEGLPGVVDTVVVNLKIKSSKKKTD